MHPSFSGLLVTWAYLPEENKMGKGGMLMLIKINFAQNISNHHF